MNHKAFTNTLALFAIAVFIVAADGIIRDKMPEGIDLPNIRCGDRIVFIGDRVRDVLRKCGDPIRVTQFLDQPGFFWVYRLGQSDQVFYFGFIDDRLNRIHDVSCLIRDNPDCE